MSVYKFMVLFLKNKIETFKDGDPEKILFTNLFEELLESGVKQRRYSMAILKIGSAGSLFDEENSVDRDVKIAKDAFDSPISAVDKQEILNECLN